MPAWCTGSAPARRFTTEELTGFLRSGLGPNRQPLTDKQKAQVTQQLASRKVRTMHVYQFQEM